MVKLSDVAALAQVSPGAVSRVLSGDPTVRIGDGTRQRIVDAAQRLGYVPNHAARALRTSRSSALALVVPDVTSAVFAELARGAEEEASERGMTMVLARAEQLDEDSTWLKRIVGAGRVDGLILQLPEGMSASTIKDIIGGDVPVVLINSTNEGPLSTLVLDDVEGVKTAVRHLHSLGHRAVGFIGGTPQSATGQRRRTGFVSALNEFGMHSSNDWITDLGYTGANGREAVTELLSAPELPTALVVANLNAALGVLAEIHAHDLRVPADISIVALHDVWYADSTWPPITTVKMPLRELGRNAVSVLVGHQPGQRAEHDVIVAPPPRIIPRASTAPPRGLLPKTSESGAI